MEIGSSHDPVIHSGINEDTLQYPSGLIDTGEFCICVTSNNYDESVCDSGYNSEAKQPEHVFISLFVEENRSSPVDVITKCSRAKTTIKNKLQRS